MVLSRLTKLPVRLVFSLLSVQIKAVEFSIKGSIRGPLLVHNGISYLRLHISVLYEKCICTLAQCISITLKVKSMGNGSTLYTHSPISVQEHLVKPLIKQLLTTSLHVHDGYLVKT